MDPKKTNIKLQRGESTSSMTRNTLDSIRGTNRKSDRSAGPSKSLKLNTQGWTLKHHKVHKVYTYVKQRCGFKSDPTHNQLYDCLVLLEQLLGN